MKHFYKLVIFLCKCSKGRSSSIVLLRQVGMQAVALRSTKQDVRHCPYQAQLVHSYQSSQEVAKLQFLLQIMEGLDKNFGDNDYGIATERQCMERAPSDNQERCAEVQRGHKKVYMCFCKGDLCNTGQKHFIGLSTIILTSIVTYFLSR